MMDFAGEDDREVSLFHVVVLGVYAELERVGRAQNELGQHMDVRCKVPRRAVIDLQVIWDGFVERLHKNSFIYGRTSQRR